MACTSSFKKPTESMKKWLRLSASRNPQAAIAAQANLAKALTLPLKQGVLKGNIVGPIFETIDFEPGAAVEFPLDFLAPGSEKDFMAYTIPNMGRIPEHHVEGDFLMVPTYDVGCSIDWALKYARDARWDVVSRAIQVLEASFVRKMNADAWHVLIAAGKGRNQVVYDDLATAGFFTKRLVSNMEVTMRRLAGGNSTSLSRGELTDVYMSPEGHQDVLSWDLTQIPDAIRTQIYLNWSTGGVARIGTVNLHDLDELGVGQEFTDYYTDTLAGTFPTDKVELVIGLDLANRDSFVMPIRARLELFEDATFHRQRRAGLYGWQEHGVAALDSRRVLLGAF